MHVTREPVPMPRPLPLVLRSSDDPDQGVGKGMYSSGYDFTRSWNNQCWHDEAELMADPGSGLVQRHKPADHTCKVWLLHRHKTLDRGSHLEVRRQSSENIGRGAANSVLPGAGLLRVRRSCSAAM
jgi:hypothetical protein